MPEFESVDQATRWVDEWVVRHSPSTFVLDAGAHELVHFARFKQAYGRFIAQFEVAVGALAELIDRINFVDKASWPDHRSVQYVLVAYNAKTFLSALDRLVKGYYVDSISLTRSLYETFVRALFVSCYPDDAYSVIGQPPSGFRRFNLTGFVRDDLGFEWDTTYGLMSTFTHSNSFQVTMALQRAVDQQGDPEQFGVDFSFDDRLAEAAIPFLQFALLAHLRFLVEQIANGTTLKDEPPLSTARDAVAFMSYCLLDHPKGYWRQVARDLQLLSEVLPIADRREDWKGFLRARRRPIG